MCVRETDREKETLDPTMSQLGWMARFPANFLFLGNAALIDSTKVSNVFSGHGATTVIKTDSASAAHLTQTELIKASQ